MAGTPLCPACYDYTGAALFNAYAGALWHRFTDHVRMSFSKVAEYQRRGAVHFHAVRVIPVTPALELRVGWGGSKRRKVVIPSIPQVLRLAEALDVVKPGLGDVAMVLAFTGMRWEEAVAVPIGNVDLDGQTILIDRTASESAGKRDIRDGEKTAAAERVIANPDIAMPAVRRLVDKRAPGRERTRVRSTAGSSTATGAGTCRTRCGGGS